MSVKSPCVDLCVFDGRTGWYQGCGRTRTETREWRKLSPFHRKAIERALASRIKTLQVESKDG